MPVLLGCGAAECCLNDDTTQNIFDSAMNLIKINLQMG